MDPEVFMFCLGVVYGMTQSLVYIYLHDTLKLPMHMIGIIGLIMVSADLLAGRLVIWVRLIKEGDRE
jgi:cytochrome c oxidase assembly factor CtaG